MEKEKETKTAEQALLEEIYDWTDDGCCWLSDAPGYAQGFKAGVRTAKDMVRDLFAKHGLEARYEKDDEAAL